MRLLPRQNYERSDACSAIVHMFEPCANETTESVLCLDQRVRPASQRFITVAGERTHTNDGWVALGR